ncbi:hypothetical protein QUA44_24375 [Microcoleus sp. N9_A2]|uniref:hypothetical protein n=1 Tax=unclassified Microcoleus TaxID=2642155 RepID=UPI002FD5C9C0
MTRLTKDQHNQIIIRYQDGELCSDRARDFEVDRSSVYSLLQRRGVQMRDRSYVFRKASGHFLNESAFDAASDDATYWLGFLLADAAIVGNTVALCLQEKDSFHLEKFRQFVEGSQAILEIESTKSCRYAFQSVKIINKLKEFGITERKSHTASVHSRLSNNVHFWRGMIDGDGSIGVYANHAKKTARMELCGSSSVIFAFCRFVEQALGLTMNPSQHRNIHRVQSRWQACGTSCQPAV